MFRRKEEGAAKLSNIGMRRIAGQESATMYSPSLRKMSSK